MTPSANRNILRRLDHLDAESRALRDAILAIIEKLNEIETDRRAIIKIPVVKDEPAID